MLQVVPPSSMTQSGSVNNLLDDWHAALELRVQAGELSPNSAASYRRGAQKFIAWCTASQQQQVDPDTFTAWKAALLAEGKKPGTVNAWLSGVKALFSWAVAHRRLAYNPAESVRGAQRTGTNRRHAREMLTDLEVQRVLTMPDRSTPTGKRDYAILALMAYTAVRSVEVCRADVQDVKTQGGRLVLYVRGKGHLQADELVVLASKVAQNAMYDWLAERGEQAGALFLSYSDRSCGKRLSLRALRDMGMRYFRAAGVRGNKTLHSLRHTAITKVIAQSGSIQKGQSVGRHRSVDTTMIYFHEMDRLSNPGEAFIDYGDSQP